MAGSDVYANIASNRFPLQRQVIYNTKQIFSLVLFLLLALHMAACFNIFQGTGQGEWISLNQNGFPADSDPFELYIDQIYFMTQTMTTVGYGDINAAKYPDYESPTNMLLLMLIQLFAIFTFTIIKDRIFSLYFDISLDEVIQNAV